MRNFFFIFKLLRIHQWTKNLFCLAGVLFGGYLLDIQAWKLGLITVISFSALASSLYIFNDIQDINRDREHPKKKFRPIASGKVPIPLALVIASFLASFSLFLAYQINQATVFCFLGYAIIHITYSLYLKHLVLLDVYSIAFGFVFRLLAGIYALNDLPTAWIVLCTFFLSLLLGFAKRRAELFTLIQSNPNVDFKQRPALKKYTMTYLDSLINATATITIISYALFTVTSQINPSLVVTVPIVYYAIMHYKYLVVVQEQGEEPDVILLKDSKIKLAIILWFFCYLVIFYGKFHLFR